MSADNDERDGIIVSGGVLARIDHLLSVGQHDRAQSLAMDLIASAPDDAYNHFVLALVLARTGEPASALETLEGALARDPDHAEAHRLRGQLQHDLGRFAAAEESYLRSIAIDPGDPFTHAAYARLLSMCDRDVEALHAAEHALSLDPDASGLHTLRANLLLFVSPENWSLGEESARTALAINPRSPRALAILGTVLLRDGRKEEAEEVFESALRIEPGEPLAMAGLAELVKGKSLLYRPMLALSMAMSRLQPDMQLGVVFGLWAIYASLLTAMGSSPELKSVRDLMTILYLGACAYTWFAEPITRRLIKRHYPWLEAPT